MKTRLTFLFLFLSIFLLTSPAISKTFTDNASNVTFDISGSTTSTSQKLAGYGSESWHVSGYASVSGTAHPFAEINSSYKCELWLYVTGDIDSSAFPGKGTIDTSEHDGIAEIVTKGDAKILYKSHTVSRSYQDQKNPLTPVVVRPLSDSVSSPSYIRSASSPTDLCASPEFHGTLEGTIQNYSGAHSLVPLSLRSKENKACADNLDDGTEVIAGEKCDRGSLCQLPGTATALDSHKVECDKDRWVDSEAFSDRLKEQLGFKAKKVGTQAC